MLFPKVRAQQSSPNTESKLEQDKLEIEHFFKQHSRKKFEMNMIEGNQDIQVALEQNPSLLSSGL